MKAPDRLLDNPEIPPALRADLEGAQRLKEPFDAAAGLSALRAAIEHERVPPPATTRSVRRLGAGVGAIAVLAAALAAAAAAGLQQRSTPPSRIEPKPVPARPAQVPRAARPAPAMQEVALEPGRPVSEEAAPKRSAATAAELQREVAQLGRVRELLDRDPGQALQLAQAGHREFRHGVLHQEREGLAVIALWRLGRTGEARERTRVFVARYPRSALREQIERMQSEQRAGGGDL